MPRTTFPIHRPLSLVAAAAAVLVFTSLAGCHKPEKWAFTGPRVYLIEGPPDEDSDGLVRIRDELLRHEINAQVYYPKNWLKIVVDIDARPDEEVILVGHGHGAFLATQVVRHYAQHHKTKFIEAVITLDAFNKDWPHNEHERGEKEPHTPPMDTPIGHNALLVRNYTQQNPESWRWGSDLVSTRASNLAPQHPYYWYDDYWDRRPIFGQHLVERVQPVGHRLPAGGAPASSRCAGDDVRHETIDNDEALVQRIVLMCRKAALSPYHYTPPKHHPDVETKARPKPTRKKTRDAA